MRTIESSAEKKLSTRPTSGEDASFEIKSTVLARGSAKCPSLSSFRFLSFPFLLTGSGLPVRMLVCRPRPFLAASGWALIRELLLRTEKVSNILFQHNSLLSSPWPFRHQRFCILLTPSLMGPTLLRALYLVMSMVSCLHYSHTLFCSVSGGGVGED